MRQCWSVAAPDKFCGCHGNLNCQHWSSFYPLLAAAHTHGMLPWHIITLTMYYYSVYHDVDELAFLLAVKIFLYTLVRLVICVVKDWPYMYEIRHKAFLSWSIARWCPYITAKNYLVKMTMSKGYCSFRVSSNRTKSTINPLTIHQCSKS